MFRVHTFLLALALLFALPDARGQVTTAGLRGEVLDAEGHPIAGAAVVAVHTPSGTRYGAASNAEGRYALAGMRVGGPYRITVSFVGMRTLEADGIMLQLGDLLQFDARLDQQAVLFDEVVVTGSRGATTRTGAAMSVSAGEFARMPSITRGIADAIRMNPYLRVTTEGAMQLAGTNNRYNSFQIDGVMHNDVYGLAANGSNGGQAGTQPVSMETIEQIQVAVAPFDVRQSGFTGGSINAITRSGTNELSGSVYGFGNNQRLIGDRYRLRNGARSGKFTDQYEYQAGITLGGPVVKNRLFFFASYERADKTCLNPYSLGSGASQVDAEQAAAILEKLRELAAAQGMNYTGSLDGSEVYARSDKAGLKLDWNLGERHKLTLRWSTVQARQSNSASDARNLNASDFTYDFVSRTHSLVAELQSRLGESVSNEFRASYVRVRDERQPGAPFPMIRISNVGDGTLNLGNDRSSMANRLDQDIFSLTDNLTWYRGSHTLTAGIHGEFYRFENLFIQDAYGSYFYSSPDDFFAARINQYRFAQADTAVTGDPRWAASFGAGIVGIYLQDDLRAAPNFDLTLGLRMDIPLFFDKPAANTAFNDFAARKGWDYRTDTRPRSTPLFSPRLGFRWRIREEGRLTLRGGAGIFTGRLPFVWLSNNFANTGIQTKAYVVSVSDQAPDATKDLQLLLNPNEQDANVAKLTASGSQLLNVCDRGFRMPQSLRADLALDFELAGIAWTAEAIYSKTLHDIAYRNLAVEPSGQTLAQSVPSLDFDRRPLLRKVEGAESYSGIYLLTNTDRGYTCTFSLEGSKHFRFGVEVRASYTFMRSMTHNNGTSSVAQSNWQFNYMHGDPNRPDLARSSFNTPHSVRAALFYTKRWKSRQTTTVGLVYQGQSGIPYSICYGDDLNGDGGLNDLIYIPTDAEADRMIFLPSATYTAEQQRANFKAWLGRDDYLKRHRGRYFERNAGNERFEHHFDLHLAHRVDLRIGRHLRSLELSFDLINAGNLLNARWGRTSASNGYYSPISYKGDGRFQFLHDADYDMRPVNDYYSRWRGQIGARLRF